MALATGRRGDALPTLTPLSGFHVAISSKPGCTLITSQTGNVPTVNATFKMNAENNSGASTHPPVQVG